MTKDGTVCRQRAHPSRFLVVLQRPGKQLGRSGRVGAERPGGDAGGEVIGPAHMTVPAPEVIGRGETRGLRRDGC